MSFFRSPNMWKSQGERYGLYWGYWSVSQLNLWSLSPSRLIVRGWALSCKMMIPSNRIPGRFYFMARRSTLSHQLLCLPPFPMLEEHTLHHAHLQSNKETTVWTCAFSLRMSPTLQMAVSIRNNNVANSCKDCVLWRVLGFHLIDPYTVFHYFVCAVTKYQVSQPGHRPRSTKGRIHNCCANTVIRLPARVRFVLFT